MPTLPEITDRNFETAPERETLPGGEIVRLPEYQKRALRTKARIAVRKWARQTGKDFTTSLEAILDASESGQNWYIISLTQRQALATAKKAQMHVRAIQAALPDIRTEEWELPSGEKVMSFGCRLSNGAEVVALPGKDPDALAGLTGNVIFTEMALFPNNGVDHWRVVFPLITRGFKLRAISTPRGPETKFAELCRNAKGKYDVQTVTIYDAVAQGLDLRDEDGKPITPEELKELYADPSGWSREYECIEGQDHEALIEWQYIHAIESDYTVPAIHIEGTAALQAQFDTANDPLFAPLRRGTLTGRPMLGRPVLGWDIAVTGDLSVIAYGEVLGDTTWLRGMVTMHGVDNLEFQEDVVRCALKTGAVGVGDATGLGREACQRMTSEFGEHRFKGMVFGAVNRTELGVQYMKTVQSVRQRIPKDNLELEYDIHSMAKREAGIAGRLQLVPQQNPLNKHSHCDMFWALAMMDDAAQAEPELLFGSMTPEESGLVTAGVWL